LEINREAGKIIMSAWKEIMTGNFSGSEMQKLYDWYMEGDKNSKEPMRIMAKNILHISGMIVSQPASAETRLPNMSGFIHMKQI